MLGEHRVAMGLLGCVQVRGMGAEHPLQRLGQVLQPVESVRDLHRPGRAMARALGKGPDPAANARSVSARSRGTAATPGWPRSHAANVSALNRPAPSPWP